MSDSNADGQSGKSGDHSEATLVPQSTELVSKSGTPEGSKRASAAPKEIMLQRLSSHSSWDDPAFRNGPAPEQNADDQVSAAREIPTKRTLSLAAIVAIAAAIGAIGGSASTIGVGHFLSSGKSEIATAEQSRVLDTAISRVSTEITALKAATATQASKLTKLSEVTEKLRAAESTGSIAAPATSAAPSTATPAPAQPGRLPVVTGWVLRDVTDGLAMVEGRQGLYEVQPGDPLPGIGRVDAIRRQDGRWVVVTSRGLIVSR